MVKGSNDEVTLTIAQLRTLFIEGSSFGREHTLLDMGEIEDEEDIQANDFGEFMSINHDIELI